MTMQLVVVPLPFIGQLARWIVDGSMAMHLPFDPLSCVYASFEIVECTVTVSQTVLSLSFVPTILLCYA